MKLSGPTINKNTAIKIGLQVVFVLVLVYATYLLHNLYSSLNQNSFDTAHAAKSRTDLTGYQKASNRYEGASSFQPDAGATQNPFGLAPDSMTTGNQNP